MIIQKDERLAGSTRYFMTREWENFVRIPDEILKCVAFVHRRRAMADPPSTTGTAFFVYYGEPSLLGMTGYAVTARHVIEKCREDSQDAKVLLRTDIREANAEFIESSPKDWFFHPSDDTVDVAVLPMSVHKGSPYLALFRTLDIALFAMRQGAVATPTIIAAEGIGHGDEVFIIGLFRNHPGKLRNIPVARIGNIAAMPGELVNSQRWHNRDIEAYLIEARSIGGLSGSPVFVHIGAVGAAPDHVPAAPGQANTQVAGRRDGSIFLLGLVHGHWDLHLPDTDSVETDATRRLEINSGMAIVVPATKIIEVLNHPALIEQRRQQDEAKRRMNAPTLD